MASLLSRLVSPTATFLRKVFSGSPLLQPPPPPPPRFFSNSLTGLASVLSSDSQPSSAVIKWFTVPIAAPEWCSKMCHGFLSTMEEFRVTMKSTRSSLLVLEDSIASLNFTLGKVNRFLDSVNGYMWYFLILLIGFLGIGMLVNLKKLIGDTYTMRVNLKKFFAGIGTLLVRFMKFFRD